MGNCGAVLLGGSVTKTIVARMAEWSKAPDSSGTLREHTQLGILVSLSMRGFESHSVQTFSHCSFVPSEAYDPRPTCTLTFPFVLSAIVCQYPWTFESLLDSDQTFAPVITLLRAKH